MRRAARPREDERLRGRRRGVERSAGRRRLRLVLALLAAIGIGVGSVAVLHSSLFSARHIEVVGNRATPTAAILEASGLDRHPPLLDVATAPDALAIERLPWIATATVTSEWPDSVRVAVTERRAVAAWTARHGEVVLLDPTGRVLETLATAPAGLAPVALSGAPPPPGASVDPADAAVVSAAAELPVGLLADVERISGGPSGVVVDLTDGVQADLGQATDLPAKMEALATLMGTERTSLSPHAVIDLRVPEDPVVTG